LKTEPAQFNNLIIAQRQPAKLQGDLSSVHVADIAREYKAPLPIPTGDAQKQALDVLSGMDIASSYTAVDYIFSHESGWRPGAVNGFGCIGLGQSCPLGSGLSKECPDWQTNVRCQVRHFTAYANHRYGSWQAAYEYWLVHHNW
jgi:hypothetical protein